MAPSPDRSRFGEGVLHQPPHPRLEERALSEQTLSNLSREERRFEPPADLAADANVKEEIGRAHV